MAIDFASIWNDYGLLIILIAVVVIAGIIRLINNMKDRKKKAKVMAKEISKKLEEAPPSEIIPEPPKELPVFDMSEYEALLGGKEESENVIEQINIINKKMRKESNDMSKKIKTDKDRLEAGLKEVLKNKQKLLEYGKEMSELYKVYDEREKQLGLTMVALNRVLGEENGGKSS